MNRQTYKDLIRPTDDRIIAGVCAGLADFFGLDSSTVRLATLLLILFGGLSIWIYVVLWLVIPEAPAPRFDIHVKNDNRMATDNKRLVRTSNGMIAGVCGGIAEYFGLDTSLVRIATLILILAGGLSLWVYIILWLIIPKAPKRLKN